MGPALKATIMLVIVIVVVLAVVGLAVYAASHLWFANHILLPILGVLFIAAIWFVLYALAQATD